MQEKNYSNENFSQQFLENLKQVYEIKRDTDISKKLELSGSTISTWKSRDSIDLRIILQRIPLDVFCNVYIKSTTKEEQSLYKGLMLAEAEVKYETQSKIELLEQENKLLRETVEILEKDLLNLQKEQNDLLKEYVQILKTNKKD